MWWGYFHPTEQSRYEAFVACLDDIKRQIIEDSDRLTKALQ